jgi:hypothetical protein
MRPLFVRELTDEERAILEAGRRSSQVFTVKRCQILLASAGGQNATAIGVSGPRDVKTYCSKKAGRNYSLLWEIKTSPQ